MIETKKVMQNVSMLVRGKHDGGWRQNVNGVVVDDTGLVKVDAESGKTMGRDVTIPLTLPVPMSAGDTISATLFVISRQYYSFSVIDENGTTLSTFNFGQISDNSSGFVEQVSGSSGTATKIFISNVHGGLKISVAINGKDVII